MAHDEIICLHLASHHRPRCTNTTQAADTEDQKYNKTVPVESTNCTPLPPAHPNAHPHHHLYPNPHSSLTHLIVFPPHSAGEGQTDRQTERKADTLSVLHKHQQASSVFSG